MPTSITQAPRDPLRKILVVFDKTDGRIIHLHEVIVLPGVAPPSVNEMYTEALTQAQKHSGINPNTMAIVPVTLDDLKPEMEYKIDLQRGMLVGARPDPNPYR